MAQELYLVRHGRTMFNEKNLMQGWCDAPLTAEGIEMAERVGRYVEHEGIAFDHAYASTLTRTQRTIERIIDLPYECVEGLCEWGFGTYEGESVSLIPEFPWGDFFVQFDGESQMQVRERVSRALGEIMERPSHECVLAVSHGSACREFLARWVPEGGFVHPGNCSVMHFIYENGEFALQEILEQDDLKAVLGE